jgi:hypothetical protein
MSEKRKVLLCATDAGGVNNIIPVAKSLLSLGHVPQVITSEKMRRMYESSGLEVVVVHLKNQLDASDIVRRQAPLSVICGTTCYESPDRLITLAARAAGVKSLVVLDEWFNYRLRFQDGNGRLAYLPNIVCCQDKLARDEAVADGIPADLLRVTGSAAYSALTLTAEELSANPPAPPAYLPSNHPVPIITFLSEAHAKDYGEREGGAGPLGQFLGYTEQSVKKNLMDAIGKTGRNCLLVDKIHPASDEAASQGVVRYGSFSSLAVKDGGLWNLLWHSDIVIGMRSAALMDAAILGCDPVSYQPDAKGSERCTAVRLGVSGRLTTQEELDAYLVRALSLFPEKKARKIVRFDCARKEVPDEIALLSISKVA